MQIRTYSKKIFSILFAFTVVFAFQATDAQAQGDLLVTPKRLIFEGQKRSHELNLANIGTDTATYVISFIQYRMRQDGTFESITQPDSAQLFADKNLRFFPRTVTLAPKEAQTVKVQLTKSNELIAGEYRSHIYFRAVLKEKPLGDFEPSKDSTISIKLNPVFGISIPAIVRVGDNNSEISLSNISVNMHKDTIPVLTVDFNRKGNMSVYGDLLVDHISDEGQVTKVGLVKGMAVYTPNAIRRFNLMLNPRVNYKKGKLHLVYSDQTSKLSKPVEAEVDLRKDVVTTK